MNPTCLKPTNSFHEETRNNYVNPMRRLKQKNHGFLAILILFLYTSVMASAKDYGIDYASYIPDSFCFEAGIGLTDEYLYVALDARESYQIIAKSKEAPVFLNGTDTNSYGVVLQFNRAGDTLIKAIFIETDGLSNFEISPEEPFHFVYTNHDNILGCLDKNGMLKWRNTSYVTTSHELYADIDSAGNVVLLKEKNFVSVDTIVILNPSGVEVDRFSVYGEISDVSIKGNSVVVVGYTNKTYASVPSNACVHSSIFSGMPIQVPFLYRYNTLTKQMDTLWDYTAQDMLANPGGSQLLRVDYGADGNIYVLGSASSDNSALSTNGKLTPYMNFLNNSQNNAYCNASSPIVSNDFYNTPSNLSTAYFGFYARILDSSFTIDKSQYVIPRKSDSTSNSFTSKYITADKEGTMYIGGAASYSIEDRENITLNGDSLGTYAGSDPTLLVVSSDFQKRNAWMTFSKNNVQSGRITSISVLENDIAMLFTIDSGQLYVTPNAIRKNHFEDSYGSYYVVTNKKFMAKDAPLQVSIVNSIDSLCVGDTFHFQASGTGGAGNYYFNWKGSQLYPDIYNSNMIYYMPVKAQQDTLIVWLRDDKGNNAYDTLYIISKNCDSIIKPVQEYSIEGTVNTLSGYCMDGVVLAYEWINNRPIPVEYAVIDSGFYRFSNLNKATYSLRAIPFNEDAMLYFPTFYQSELLWFVADKINLLGKAFDVDIDLILMPVFVFNANANVSGSVSCEDSSLYQPEVYNYSNISNAQTGSGLVVFLYDEQKNVIAWTIADSAGNYAFSNLPAGNYYTGISKTGFSNYSEEIIVNGVSNYQVDLQLKNEDAVLTSAFTEQDNNEDVNVYPNPVTENVTFDVSNLEDVQITLFDCKGILWKNFATTQSQVILNKTELPRGIVMYIIQSKQKVFEGIIVNP